MAGQILGCVLTQPPGHICGLGDDTGAGLARPGVMISYVIDQHDE